MSAKPKALMASNATELRVQRRGKFRGTPMIFAKWISRHTARGIT